MSELNINTAIDVANLKKDVKSLEIRMNKQDELNESIRSLVNDISCMTVSIQYQIEEQKEMKNNFNIQDKRIDDLEKEPLKQAWSFKNSISIGLTVTFFTSLVTLFFKLLLN